jgi:glycine C-acetyltransferase
MSWERYRDHYAQSLDDIRRAGTWKAETDIVSSQQSHIELRDAPDGPPRPALNFCANNYLGLANHPEIVEAACQAMRERGFGMASVRFICGKQDLHARLEEAITRFLRTGDTILYGSCFDANGALFEALLGPEDAILTDELNHASIIDGVRLCKARRRIVKHSDMGDLRSGLQETRDARVRLIVTDGVFSMHGDIAKLGEICSLADEHGALVVVDDSHATGVVGETGRGTPELFGVEDRVDLITSTMGKAIGGGSGGFTTGRAALVALLRQKSRPYLFSNSLAPAIVGGSLKALEIVEREPERIRCLRENTRYFRDGMAARGFRLAPGQHPIVPIVLGDEKRTHRMATALFERGIYVVGFSYPVVPKGQARIRVQVSAGHSREDLDRAMAAFEECREESMVDS